MFLRSSFRFMLCHLANASLFIYCSSFSFQNKVFENNFLLNLFHFSLFQKEYIVLSSVHFSAVFAAINSRKWLQNVSTYLSTKFNQLYCILLFNQISLHLPTNKCIFQKHEYVIDSEILCCVSAHNADILFLLSIELKFKFFSKLCNARLL